MDLIAEASLPNKGTHRMTPTESEELNKQVHELGHKGLIQESLSPCIVPVVLAPNKNEEWRMCITNRHLTRNTRLLLKSYMYHTL